MSEFNLYDEFRKTGVRPVPKRAIETVYKCFGNDISKEQFLSIDFNDKNCAERILNYRYFGIASLRKIVFLQKFIKGEVAEYKVKIAMPEDELFRELEKQRDSNFKLNRKIDSLREKINNLEQENIWLEKELAKRDKVVKKYGKLAGCLCEFQNAYADCLVEDTENERTESIK